MTLQFRVEALNIFNNRDFDLPNTSLFALSTTGGAIPNPVAGQITDTSTRPGTRMALFAWNDSGEWHPV